MSLPRPRTSPFAHLAALPVLLLLALLSHLLIPGLRAQTVRWEPASGTLATGVISGITLIYEDCEPKGDPAPPKVPGLMLALRGSSQQTTVVNFKTNTLYRFEFAARLEKKEAVEIPAFAVATDKGSITVPAARFTPGDSGIGNTKLTVEDIAQSKFLFPSETVWAGEVFSLSYKIDILRRYYHQIASNPEWDPLPLVTEEWTKPEPSESTVKGERQLNILYRTRAFVKDPGSVQFNAAQQLVNIRTGSSGGFGFFAQEELQQLAISSDQPKLTVKPLPQPAPAAFAGAVGQFKLASRVVPSDAKEGEPITWTLELSGSGNWPAILGLPSRSVPKSFEVIQPQAKRTISEGKLFDGTLSEDLVMIPKTAGTYTLPPVTLSYFDPRSGSYQTLTTERVTLRVAAAARPQQGEVEAKGPAKTGPQGRLDGQSGGAPVTLPERPAAAEPVPGDPTPRAEAADRPLAMDAVLKLVLLPLLLVPAAWLIFAVLRALATDPGTPRRAALRRLRKLLAGTQPAGAALHAHLRQWQTCLAASVGLTEACPSPKAVLARLPERMRGQYEQLWRETDALLYGPVASLPQDWTTRARAAAAGLGAPALPPLSIARHLLPALMVSLFLIQTAATAAGPDNGDGAARKAYSAGNYAEAGRLWAAAIDAQPLDWSARHNLGLAQLQQGHAGAACAQLGAAFAQNPSSETLRRDFRIACAQAGVTPEILGELSNEGPLSELARLQDIRGWQESLAWAALLAAAGLILLLARAYGRRHKAMLPAALGLLLCGVLAATACLVVLRHYGMAADSRAALIWQNSTLRSIPTEADATQKTSALPAGTLAIVDNEFLGWRHLTFSNGDSGWVRAGDLVPLWR